MRITGIIIIAIALVISGATFFLIRSYLASQTPAQVVSEMPPVASVQVAVAARNLPAGTTLQESDVRWQSWPDISLDPNYIVQRNGQDAGGIGELVGSVVRRGISGGDPVTMAKVFMREDAGFLAGALAPGMRAVSIRVNAVSGAAGFIMPGDHVDIILTQEIGRSEEGAGAATIRRTSETILKGARVLAIDQSTDDFEGVAQIGQTATVEVTPKQAELITVAADMGKLSLALRSLSPGPADNYAAPFTSDLDVSFSLGGNPDPAFRTAPSAPEFSVAAAPPSGPRVLVASRDLPVGTLLRDDFFHWAVAPLGSRPGDFFLEGRDPHEPLRGALVVASLTANQPLDPDAVVRSDAPDFLASALIPGARAVSVGPAAISDIAGIARPGDRVDVVLTREGVETGEAGEQVTKITTDKVLENVRILAFNQRRGTATIELSPKQAAEFAVATTQGKIRLAMNASSAPTLADRGSRPDGSREMSGTQVALADQTNLANDGAPAGPRVASAAGFGIGTTRVLVASRDLSAGTLLGDNDFRWAALPIGTSTQGYFVHGMKQVQALRGSLIREDVSAGSPITDDKLMRAGEDGFLVAALAPGMRAVSVGIDPVSGISGFVSAGDRVDVILTHEIKDDDDGAILDSRRYSETIVSDVRVLAIEQTVDESSGKPVVGKTATVEVPPKQAEALALGASMGTLSLALRGRHPDVVVSDEGMPFTSDVEISEATTSLILRSEPIYAGRSLHKGDSSLKQNKVVRVYRAVNSSTVLVGE